VYEHFTRHLNAHVTITASNCTNIDWKLVLIIVYIQYKY
jgi:hypothetical protein